MAHIDTLQTFDNLITSGISEKEARAHVRNLESSFNNIATKEDLKNLEKDLKSDIKNLEINLENKIDSKFNLLMILGSVMFLVIIQPILEKLDKKNLINLLFTLDVALLVAIGYILPKKDRGVWHLNGVIIKIITLYLALLKNVTINGSFLSMVACTFSRGIVNLKDMVKLR